MLTTLDAALSYLSLGWKVLPVHGILDGHCTCGDAACSKPGKHPVEGLGLDHASADAGVVRGWWAKRPTANIGIACAASGLLALDVDRRHGGDATLAELERTLGPLPRTRRHRTGGGWHFLFVAPADFSPKGQAGPGIDIKFAGYVVAPPSMHASGKRYEVEDDSAPAELPMPWVRAISKAAPVAHPTPMARHAPPAAYAQRALDAEVAAVVAAQEGARNTTLNNAAFSLGQLVGADALDRGVVERSLLRAAIGAGLGEAEATATIASGLAAGEKEPRQAPERSADRPSSSPSSPEGHAGDWQSGFKSSAERLRGEADRRRALVARKIDFGVTFLDEALGGILPYDLVILGAFSGGGKTQAATLLARNAVAAGKRVHYFALEAEPDEIERRLKYNALATRWFATPRTWRGDLDEHRLSYRGWYGGELDDLLRPLDADVEADLIADLANLQTCYRGRAFGLEELEREMRGIEGNSDLAIVDHLHYIDVGDENENRAYRRIVQRVRDLSLASGIPVVLVVHLRKKDRGFHPVVPDLDDVMGSSDIAKTCTKAIFLARVEDSEASAEEKVPRHLWRTYMACRKDRMGGSTSRYVALAYFDQRTNSYEKCYSLGYAVGEKWRPLEQAAVPPWATSARQPAASQGARGRSRRALVNVGDDDTEE